MHEYVHECILARVHRCVCPCPCGDKSGPKETLLYFEINIDHSESPTYTTKHLQCAFLAIAATLIALL